MCEREDMGGVTKGDGEKEPQADSQLTEPDTGLQPTTLKS